MIAIFMSLLPFDSSAEEAPAIRITPHRR